jgi:hypothetical protein
MVQGHHALFGFGDRRREAHDTGPWGRYDLVILLQGLDQLRVQAVGELLALVHREVGEVGVGRQPYIT